MGGTLILLGFFLWFAMAFNGGVGETFVNYSAFVSGLFMVVSGVLAITNSGTIYIRILTMLALICYGAIVWQRFHFTFGTDWVGFVFDGIYIVCMLAAIIRSNPNKSPKSGAPQSGAFYLKRDDARNQYYGNHP